MKRLGSSIAAFAVMFMLLPVQTRAAELLIPVGKIIGLQLQDDTVVVAAYDEVLGANARNAGLKIGDEIVKVEGVKVRCAQDVRDAIHDEEEIHMTVRRGSKVTNLTLTPNRTGDGAKLGVYLRQGIAGIGTVTFYDPETGKFGTLGHGVSGPQGGLLKMTRGQAYEAELLSIRKGKAGEPGQLKGAAREDGAFADLLKNTPQGVFGISRRGWRGEPTPIAAYSEIETGPAAIKCTVDGDTTREYSVEILKIYPQSKSDGRNFLLKVTDPELLAITGGIVQGMSGSPILQNGKIVGAVTHVLVQDATTGYGIYIGNMLEAAA